MSTKGLVLVTGPTGFVGAHVFSALLNAGYQVKGTIRSASKAKYLESKFSSYSNDISFITVPDLQAEHALDEAVKDVDYICHVASPYHTATTEVLKDLIEPAVNGTKNVLASAMLAPKLKRVVVLSSFAAINNLPLAPRPGYVYTEADWNPVTMEEAVKNGGVGYSASKAFAERAAWDMWKEAKESGNISWDLVTLNPPMIYGPPLHEVDVAKGIPGLNTSLSRLLAGMTGTDPSTAPKVSTPGLPHWVDVRDVAAAHVKALGLASGTSERFALFSSAEFFENGLTELRAQGAEGLGEEGAKIDTAKYFTIDASKAKKELGMDFIPFKQTMADVYAWAKEVGFIKV